MAKELERWFDNSGLSPYRDFSQLQKAFDRLFSEFQSMKKSSELKEFDFSPSCEIAEEENSYVFKFDLPGVNRDQVKVEVDKDRLTVQAERKEEKEQKTRKKFLSEVSYGSYSRSFTLPGPIDDKKIDARFENGVLTVTVPKTETSKSKQISIH